MKRPTVSIRQIALAALCVAGGQGVAWAQTPASVDADIHTDVEAVRFDSTRYDTVDLAARSALYERGVGLFKSGLEAYLAKDYDRAYSIFEQVLKLDPLHEESFLLLLRSKAKMGIVEIEMATTADSTESVEQLQERLFRDGLNAYSTGDFAKAKRTWDRLYALNGRFPQLRSYMRKLDKDLERSHGNAELRTRLDSLFRAGTQSYAEGRALEARALLDSVVLLDPLHKDAVGLLVKVNEDLLQEQLALFRDGMVRYSQGDYAEAITAWRTALELDSTNALIAGYLEEASVQLGQIRQLYLSEARRLLDEGRLKPALDEYEAILRFSPDDSAARPAAEELRERYRKEVDRQFNEAVAAYNSGDYTTSVSILESVIKLDPAMAAAREYMAKGRSRLVEAESNARRQGLRTDAESLEQASRWDEAAAVWDELLRLDSLDATARERRDACGAEAKRLRGSLETQKLLAASIDHYRKGQVRKARELWDKVLVLDPGNAQVVQMAKAVEEEQARLLESAKASMNAGKWRAAVTALTRLLSIDPDNAVARAQLDAARRALADEERKAAAAAAGPGADPAKIEKLFNTGLEHYMARQYEQALTRFEEIVTLDPENSRAVSYVKNLQGKLKRLKKL